MRSRSTLSVSSSGASTTCLRVASRSWRVSSSSTMRAWWDCTSCASDWRCRSSTKDTHCCDAAIFAPGARGVCGKSHNDADRTLRASRDLAHSPDIALEDARRADLVHAVTHREHDRRDLDPGRGEKAAHAVAAHAGARHHAHVARLCMFPRVAAGIALAHVADLHLARLLGDPDGRRRIDLAVELRAAPAPDALPRADEEPGE